MFLQKVAKINKRPHISRILFNQFDFSTE